MPHLKDELQYLIDTVKHVVCYIRKDKGLMQAIESYCRDLPVAGSDDLNEKAYWFLHSIREHPHCQFRGCMNLVAFAGLRTGYRTACCKSHASSVARPKTVATNLERYGSATPLQNKEIRAKIIQHNLETYGTPHVLGSEHFKKKSIETHRKNFGTDWPMQCEETRAKSRKTCKDTYGVEYVLQDSASRAKGRETSNALHGVEWPMQCEEVKAKSRSTMQRNYGVDAPAQCPEIRRKQQMRCTYNGLAFDSTYEIAYYIWLADSKTEFTYEPGLKFMYMHEGKTHWYMPDFVVDGQIVEIKGDHFFKEDGTMCNPFDHSQDALYEAKHQCMIRNNVKVMRTSEMNGILAYIASTYGKDYLKQFRNVGTKDV